jgi:hypothetical protein
MEEAGRQMKLLEQTNLLEAPSPEPRITIQSSEPGRASTWCCDSQRRIAGVHESSRLSYAGISLRLRPTKKILSKVCQRGPPRIVKHIAGGRLIHCIDESTNRFMNRLTLQTRRMKKATSEHIEQDWNPIDLPIEGRAQLSVGPQSSSVDGNGVSPSFELLPGCCWG